MERNSAAVHSHTMFGSSCGGDHLKRSPSQLDFEECLQKIARDVTAESHDRSFAETGDFFPDVFSGDLTFAFKNRVSHTRYFLVSPALKAVLCHVSSFHAL